MKELTREYAIPLDLFEKAFVAYQKKFVYPRNWVITLVLLVVIGIYVHAALQDPENMLSYILIMMSAAVIFITWFNVKKIRRNLMDSVRELEDDRYRLTITEEGFLLRTLLPEQPAVVEETEEEIKEKTDEPEDKNGFNPVFGEDTFGEIPPSEFLFTQNIRVKEYDEFYSLYLEKGMFYVIPKHAYSEEELREIESLLTEKLDKRFIPMKK
ncbi:MAG: YcxB family protein [Ruminococcus sp.]|nr:YcxB family protein [Ruminococcus sp.]